MTDAYGAAEIARSRVNDFFIQRWTGGDPEPIAAAVFPLGALLAHACAPTCVAPLPPGRTRRTAPSRRGYKSSGAAGVGARRSSWTHVGRERLGQPPARFRLHPPVRLRVRPRALARRTSSARRSTPRSARRREGRLRLRGGTWAALAMPPRARARVTIEIAAKLLRDAERAEEVSRERELAEKAAGLLRGLTEALETSLAKTENPYAPRRRRRARNPNARARAAMASNMAMFESDFEAALRLGEELVACLTEGYGARGGRAQARVCLQARERRRRRPRRHRRRWCTPVPRGARDWRGGVGRGRVGVPQGPGVLRRRLVCSASWRREAALRVRYCTVSSFVSIP